MGADVLHNKLKGLSAEVETVAVVAALGQGSVVAHKDLIGIEILCAGLVADALEPAVGGNYLLVAYLVYVGDRKSVV